MFFGGLPARHLLAASYRGEGTLKWIRLRIRRLEVMPCPGEWGERAHVNAAKYKDMYEFSASDPDSFWEYHGKRIDWIKPFTKVKRTCFDPGNVSIKWFEGGTTNLSSTR